MEILEEVQEALRDGSLLNAPHLAAEYRSKLSGEYSYLMGMLEQLKADKPIVWLEMRKEYKSDTATDRAYEGTTSGRDEIVLRGRIKRIEKLLSGLSTIVKDAEQQALNHY